MGDEIIQVLPVGVGVGTDKRIMFVVNFLLFLGGVRPLQLPVIGRHFLPDTTQVLVGKALLFIFGETGEPVLEGMEVRVM